MVNFPEKWRFRRGDQVRVVEVYDGLEAKVGDMATVVEDILPYPRSNLGHAILYVKFDPPKHPGRDFDGGYWVCQFERAGGPW